MKAKEIRGVRVLLSLITTTAEIKEPNDDRCTFTHGVGDILDLWGAVI